MEQKMLHFHGNLSSCPNPKFIKKIKELRLS